MLILVLYPNLFNVSFIHKLIFLQNQIHYQRERVTIVKSSFLIFIINNMVIIIPIHAEFYCGIWFLFVQKAHRLHVASYRKCFYIQPLLECFNKCMLTMIRFINTNLTIVRLWSPLNTIFTIF